MIGEERTVPMQRAERRRDQQLLLRITAPQMALLESIAHLERMTANGYAHQILVQHLALVAGHPRVRADLDNRAAYAADVAAASLAGPTQADDGEPVADATTGSA